MTGAILGMFIGIVSTMIAKRRLSWGAALVGIAAATHAWMLERLPLSQPGSGLTVYLEDSIFCGLFAAGLLRMAETMRGRNINRIVQVRTALIGCFSLCCAVSFARGIAIYGTEPVSYEAREYFYYIGGVVYGFSYLTDYRTSLFKELSLGYLIGGAAIIAIILFRWSYVVRGKTGSWTELTSGTPYRVVGAQEALFLLEGAFVFACLRFGSKRKGSAGTIVVIFSAFVILLQHRTVWIVFLAWAAGIAWMTGTSKKAIAGAMILAGVMFGGLILGASPDLKQSFGESVSEVTSEKSTFQWRVEGWKTLIGEQLEGGSLTIILGEPFGRGYLRRIWGHVADVAPHNFYLQSFVRLGAAGLICWLALTWSAMVGHKPRGGGLLLNAPAMMIAGFLIYYVSYGNTYSHGLILGLALAVPPMMKGAVDGNRVKRATDRRGGRVVQPPAKDSRCNQEVGATSW